jgi:hypothetical protein
MMGKSLLRSIIEDRFDIKLIGWILLMVGAISIIFGLMAALGGLTSQMNGSVVEDCCCSRPSEAFPFGWAQRP